MSKKTKKLIKSDMHQLESLLGILQNLKKNPNRTYTSEYIQEKQLEISQIWDRILEETKPEELEDTKTYVRDIVSQINNLLKRKEDQKNKMAKFDILTAGKLLPEFNGDPKTLSNFLGLVKFYSNTLTSEEDKTKLVEFVLETRLADKVRNSILTETKPKKLDDLEKTLAKIYKPTKNPLIIHNELARSYQGNLSVSAFAERIEALTAQLNEVQIAQQGDKIDDTKRQIIVTLNDQLGLNAFRNGLNETNRQVVLAARVSKLREAIQVATETESRPGQSNIMRINANSRYNNQRGSRFSYRDRRPSDSFNNKSFNNRSNNNGKHSNQYQGYRSRNTKPENSGIPGQQNRGNFGKRRY